MHFVFYPRKFSDFMGLFLLNSKKCCNFAGEIDLLCPKDYY